MSRDSGRAQQRLPDRERDRDVAPSGTAQRATPPQPEAATAPMTPISFAKAFNWGGGATHTRPLASPPSPLGRPVAAPDSAAERAARATEARQRGAPDLTGVRVHTDARADGYARTLGADALTLGQDIFVARAAWNPGSAATHALLAHELHHARHGEAGVVFRKSVVERSDDPVERLEVVDGGVGPADIGSSGVLVFASGATAPVTVYGGVPAEEEPVTVDVSTGRLVGQSAWIERADGGDLSDYTFPFTVSVRRVARLATGTPRQVHGGPTRHTEPSQIGVLDAAEATEARLKELLSSATLSGYQFKEARAAIASLPLHYREPWYEKLQTRTPYLNQRANVIPSEQEDGGSCAPTAHAMGIQIFGLDAQSLISAADTIHNQQGQKIGTSGVYAGAIEDISGGSLHVYQDTTGKFHERAYWETSVAPLLAAGFPVVMSQRGHLVRVQAVTPDGLVIDDPFGKAGFGSKHYTSDNTNLSEQAVEKGWYHGDDSAIGEDNLWTWQNVADLASIKRVEFVAPAGWWNDVPVPQKQFTRSAAWAPNE